MPEILNLHGINFSNGTDKLLVNRYGVFKIYNATTGAWDNVASPTFSATALMDSENFLDHAFFVNGSNANQSFNSSSNWSTTTNVSDSPIAKYIKEHKLRLYLGYVTIRGTDYPSRVWFSDLPKNNGIVWGLETGTDLAQTSGSATVTSAGSTFLTNNIKVGDSFLIENGDNAGEYTVRTIDSETQITLTETLSNTASNSNFWVGRNYIDIKTDNGDVITGFGGNSNELLIFKKLSLHRYNVEAGTLRQVKQVPGTTSPKSIVDLDEYTYYYDSKSDAIRRYNGGTAVIISHAIEDIMQNISSSMRDSVIGYSRRGKYIEFFIGDVTTRDGESITNCAIVWDTVNESWSLRRLPWVVEDSADWIQSDRPESYIATSNGKVLLVDSGFTYEDQAIPFDIIDQPIFPEGRGVIVDFERVRFYMENGHDMQIMYRVLYMPKDGDVSWSHSDWHPLEGKTRHYRSEFSFKTTLPRRGSGIQFRFIQSSSKESFLLETYEVFYSGAAIK